jgi:hypothetical protein
MNILKNKRKRNNIKCSVKTTKSRTIVEDKNGTEEQGKQIEIKYMVDTIQLYT